MDLTKKEILKKAMSVKYCGETRFDFLDKDEAPLIYKAMEKFAEQEAKAFANWIQYQDTGRKTTDTLWKEFRERIS